MKHLLNNLTEEEKNSIRGQHTGGMTVVNENFSKLVNTKSGNVKTLVEQAVPKQFKPYPKQMKIVGDDVLRWFNSLGGVKVISNHEFQFKDKEGKIWVVSKEWVINEKGVDDQPKFLDPRGDGNASEEFINLFNGRTEM